MDFIRALSQAGDFGIIVAAGVAFVIAPFMVLALLITLIRKSHQWWYQWKRKKRRAAATQGAGA